jgi:F-type H+-transporting ATPase subunit gamma
MANTRQVKRRITTAKNISKITKAMEMVAASKMKRAQEQALAARPYALELLKSLRQVTKKTDASMHPLLSKHTQGQRAVIVVATDKGLCGSLNTHLLKQLLQLRTKYGAEMQVIAVGKKAVLFSRIAGLPIAAQFTDLPEKIAVKDILPISSFLMNQFLKQIFQSVDLVYMDFVNTLKQVPRQERLLPIAKTVVNAESVNKWTDGDLGSTAETMAGSGSYKFEPSAQEVLETLLPFYIENSVYHAFLEAKASEHSARMVAMKNASENAGELVEELLLIFNKGRQQAITSELLDITTASLTLA